MSNAQHSLDLAEEAWGSTPITRSELYLRTIALQNERIIDLLERIEVDTVELVRTLTNIAEAGL